MVTTLTRGPAATHDAAPDAPAALTLAEMERRHIAAALERTGWHQGRAAAQLGISVKTLYRKIRTYGFQRPGTPSQ
jgi:two-component system NtrC family response regulator